MGVPLFPGYGEKLGGAGGRSDLNSARSIIRSKHWCYTASNRISPQQDNKNEPLFIIFIFFLKNNTNKIKWKKASENNYNATGSPFWCSKKRNTFTQKVYIYIHLNGYGQKSSLGRPLMKRTTQQPALHSQTSPNWIQEGHEIRWKADTFFSFLLIDETESLSKRRRAEVPSRILTSLL